MMIQLAEWNMMRKDNKMAVGQTHRNMVEMFHRVTFPKQKMHNALDYMQVCADICIH